MSLLIPNSNDHHDAYGDLDEDEKYRAALKEQQKFTWSFSPVLGFFKQTDPETNDMEFRYTQEDFGILKPWSKIIAELEELNDTTPENVHYKLVFFARHGQGWANVAGRKYSKQEWYDKWRFLGTDGEITWGPDADLTELGEKQALENQQAWKEQLENKGAPYPKKFYVSPLQRSIKTHSITWNNQEVSVVENLRETIGLHLCHRRSNKSVLETKFPHLKFPDDFKEEDEQFDSWSRREELHEQFLRINKVLENIFDEDEGHKKDADVICVTSHAGTIRAFITVLGHRKFVIPTGGMIPIVIRGERKKKNL